MKILAIEKQIPDISAERFQPHLKIEAARIWELHQAQIIREIYFRADKSQAVLILECANLSEARENLESLPLVQQGLISFEIIPLAPYPGFARLFA